MTVKDILKALSPKNQNLPEIKLESSAKKHSKINILVFEGEEKKVEKLYADLKGKKISGKAKELKEIITKDQVYWIHGMGPKEEMTPRKWRRFFGQTYLAALAGKPQEIVMECPLEAVEMAVIGIHVAALNPAMFKKEAPKDKAPSVFLTNKEFKKNESKAKKSLKKGQNTAEAKNLMRILGAMGPNDLNPSTYAQVTKALAKEWKVKIKQCSQAELKKYEILNAVCAGSNHDAQLMVMTLHPKQGKTKQSTVLVGKGVCYDAGGLNVKPYPHSRHMKLDMCGSAAALATVMELVKNKRNLKETTHVLMPLVENSLDANSMRPDDIYTAGDGQKVEILNTDAEGRLIMADALCYAKNNFKNARRFMTIATLTGSCVYALGDVFTGVICNDPQFAKEIVEAGEISGDRMHPSPWDMEYDTMNSQVADVGNLSQKDREAGWITAAHFLHRFAPKPKNKKEKVECAYFDIAGSIDMDQKGKPWRHRGLSSGVAVGMLAELLCK